MTKPQVNNNIYKDIGDHWYNSNNYVALLRQESQTRDPWVLAKIKTYFKDSISNIKILDVACGGGFLSNYLAKNNLNVTGIDLYPEALEVAKKHDSTHSVKYLQADAYKLPFENEQFDCICMMDFLEHIDDIPRVIKESSRVLKKNGLIFFHTFNRNFLSWLIAIKGVEWFVKETPKNLHVHHLFLKPKELIEFFNIFDFELVEMIGVRPEFSWKRLLRLLLNGQINEDFKFKISQSLTIGFMGFVKKI